MIDVLLQLFGPALANKLFSDDSKSKLTLDDVAQALVELGEETHKNADLIKTAQKELKRLSPTNITKELDAITDWMRRHVESEEQTLRELAQKQLYWNVSLACAAGLALVFSILCLAK